MDCSEYSTTSLPLPIPAPFLLVPCCVAITYLLQLSIIVFHEVEHGYIEL